MASSYHALKQGEQELTTLVCVTGQHQEMVVQVLTFFDIQPDIDLNLMKKWQDLFDITYLVLLGMRVVFQQQRPDLILLHGDTSTSSAASIDGFYVGLTVGHEAAELRTHNIRSPFTKEFSWRVRSLDDIRTRL